MAAAAEDPGDMGCTRDAILDALENLTADEFKKFKMKLLSVPLREGFGRIPRGTLLPLDAVDLTDKLVSYYLEAYGAELTALVLRDMGMQEVAEQLQEAMSKGERAPGHTPRGLGQSPLICTLLPAPTFASPGAFTSCSSYPFIKASPAREASLPALGTDLGFRAETSERLGDTIEHFLTGPRNVPAEVRAPLQKTAKPGKAFNP